MIETSEPVQLIRDTRSQKRVYLIMMMDFRSFPTTYLIYLIITSLSLLMDRVLLVSCLHPTIGEKTSFFFNFFSIPDTDSSISIILVLS